MTISPIGLAFKKSKKEKNRKVACIGSFETKLKLMKEYFSILFFVLFLVVDLLLEDLKVLYLWSYTYIKKYDYIEASSTMKNSNQKLI